MQIEIKELESCKLSVHYIADTSEILAKRGEVLNHFRKAPVPGNRQGKASLEAIRIHYHSQIEESLKRALAEDAYHNTLFEKKLRPHGAPRFNAMFLADGKFSCDFDLNVKPDFELADYKNLELPKPHESTNANEVTEKMLQELRIRFGEAAPFTESDLSQKGDNVIIDYEGFIDNVKHESICAEGEMLTIGASKIEEFDNNILGMKLGETREFNMTVPDNGLPSIAGKTVVFKVTLNMGSKITPCPLNDELAKKFGKETYDELREFVHGSAMAKMQSSLQNLTNEAVAAKLVELNQFEVPNWLSLSEAQYLVHSAKLDWTTMPDMDKVKYMQVATNNVRLSLILDRVRENEPDAQLSDQEVFEMIKQNLTKTKLQTSLDDIIKEMQRTGYLQILFSRIRDEFTLQYLVKITKFIE